MGEPAVHPLPVRASAAVWQPLHLRRPAVSRIRLQEQQGEDFACGGWIVYTRREQSAQIGGFPPRSVGGGERRMRDS